MLSVRGKFTDGSSTHTNQHQCSTYNIRAALLLIGDHTDQYNNYYTNLTDCSVHVTFKLTHVARLFCTGC